MVEKDNTQLNLKIDTRNELVNLSFTISDVSFSYTVLFGFTGTRHLVDNPSTKKLDQKSLFDPLPLDWKF